VYLAVTFLVMDVYSGSLFTVLAKRGGMLDADKVLMLLYSMVQALSAAYGVCVVHRCAYLTHASEAKLTSTCRLVRLGLVMLHLAVCYWHL
jgi:hypothetical protein